VVRDPARRASNWRSTTSLTDELVRQEIVGLAGIDTRALTRHVRELGAMRGGIFSGGELTDVDSMVAQVKASPIMEGASWAGEVSTKNTYVVPAVGEKKFTVVALDLGIKANTPRMMSERGIEVHVLNNAATIDDILAINPDGVFLSNGPGDPATAEHEVAVTKEVLARKIPFFGICFGNQILGRALGVKTYKMKYGHRGINVPIIDTRTGKVAITAQNHGFAIEGTAGETFETPYGTALFSHYCPNDGTIEGLQLLDGPAFSVQYHPEAAAGPHDAANLFDEFVALMSEGK
jgi:carbamoyl-phosphate synthase small subunit